jgi:hypothetical protein
MTTGEEKLSAALHSATPPVDIAVEPIKAKRKYTRTKISKRVSKKSKKRRKYTRRPKTLLGKLKASLGF